ncbi:unnamed protein product [Cochlearia groenlandica]
MQKVSPLHQTFTKNFLVCIDNGFYKRPRSYPRSSARDHRTEDHTKVRVTIPFNRVQEFIFADELGCHISGSFGFQIDYDTRYLYEGQVVRISNFEVGRQLRCLARGQAAQEFYAGYDPHQDDEFVFVALLFWRVFYFGNDFVEIRSCAGGFSTVRFNPDYPEFEDFMTRYL